MLVFLMTSCSPDYECPKELPCDEEVSEPSWDNVSEPAGEDSSFPTQPSFEPSQPSEEPAGEPVEERVPCELTPMFTAPQDYEFFGLGAELSVVANVGIDVDLSEYTLRWEDGSEQIIAEVSADEQGNFTYSGSDFTQGQGAQSVHARLVSPEGACQNTAYVRLFVCGMTYSEDFAQQPADWVLSGDATWDPGGWLEMTGLYQGRRGAVYNDLQVISDGAASLRFTIKTGMGSEPGADGFSFTIIDVADPSELETLLSEAAPGGGLGYGFGGMYGSWVGDAITVEIDTWYNNGGGTTEHTDPTEQNHIAITQGADPSDHLAWFEVPDVEDFQPHTIRVDIWGNMLRVWYDGNQVIDQGIVLGFKGGHMFFTGSTGYYYNYHIFDDLEILHQCQ